MSNVRKNVLAQECAECAGLVRAGQGWQVTSSRVQDMGQKIVYHRECAPDYVRQEWTRANRKALTKEGHVYHPYQETKLSKLRALPGAWWDADNTRWCVSLEAQDRERLLEGARELKLEVDPELLEDTTTHVAREAEQRALDAKLGGEIAACARWLSTRIQAIVNLPNDHIPATMCAIPSSRGTILVADQREVPGWKKAHEVLRPDLTLHELESKRDWFWPQPGQVLLTIPGRLPVELVPTVIGVDDSGKKIKAVNLRPESRVACERTTLIVDDLNLVSSFSSRPSQKIWGLTLHVAATWFLWPPPINEPAKLWDILRVGRMTQATFSSWPEFKRCFGGRAGRWNRMAWATEPKPEALDRLHRICYRRP